MNEDAPPRLNFHSLGWSFIGAHAQRAGQCLNFHSYEWKCI